MKPSKRRRLVGRCLSRINDLAAARQKAWTLGEVGSADALTGAIDLQYESLRVRIANDPDLLAELERTYRAEIRARRMGAPVARGGDLMVAQSRKRRAEIQPVAQ